MLEDPAGEAFAAAGRIRGLVPGEGGGDVLAARPDVPADEILVGRDRPQRRHVPVEAPAQCREDALGRRLVDGRVGEDLEQLARQLRPALKLLLVALADDADDHRPRQRVVEDADDQLGADIGPVGPLDVDVERRPDQIRGLRVHEGGVVVADGRRERIGHEVVDGAPDEGAAGPAQQFLRRPVDVSDGALVVGGHDGVAQAVEHHPYALDGPGRVRGCGGDRRSRDRRRRCRCRCRCRRRVPDAAVPTPPVPIRRLRRGRVAVGAGCREGHGEPHGLARPVAPHLNAPGVGQRADNVQPAPVRRVRFLFAVAWGSRRSRR